jgi:hypothetical protein
MNQPNIVSIGLPSTSTPGQEPAVSSTSANTGKSVDEVAYKFPPVVWMFIFLIAGYVGVRMVLED